eukprot:2960984-Rhodomonas_salina.1
MSTCASASSTPSHSTESYWPSSRAAESLLALEREERERERERAREREREREGGKKREREG